MKTIGRLFGVTIGLICLAINDYRYASQLSTVWYVLFLAFCFVFFGGAKKRKSNRVVGVSLFLVGLTLCAYFISFPKFTYKQAVIELRNIYGEEDFVFTPNMKYQKMAPQMESGRVSYYCYVVETNGRYYFFDQHTGLYGRVITDPENVL